SAFLGLTMSCCRCHDHKFDPLSQADHYRLRAFFEAVKFADDVPIDLASEQDAIAKQNAMLETQAKPLQEAREALLNAAKDHLRAERLAKLSDEERDLLKQEGPQPDDVKAKSEALKKKIEPEEKDVIASLSPEAGIAAG